VSPGIGTGRVEPLHLAGAGAAAFVLLLTLGTLSAVALRAEAAAALGPADWAAVRFTVVQALVSAMLSCLLAVPVARALARRRFPGRGLLVTLLGAPFLLPVIVAVLGLLAIYGRAGLVSRALAALGMPPLDIYGFDGVVLAHVFFNLPLATRLLLHGWLAVPAERFRLAASLGLGPREVARLIEWPMLRGVLPGAFAVIFLICLTSFAVALTLGGGPRATTVELAIYQAFLYDFDLGRAALLALVQVALTLVAAGVSLRLAAFVPMGPGLDRAVERWDAEDPWLRAQDALLLAAAAAFLLLPIGAVIAAGARALPGLPAPVWEAAGRSLAVALVSAALTLALALPLAVLIERLKGRRGGALAEGIGYLTVAASPLVMGTGLFIVLRPFADPAAVALPVTAAVNAAMTLPFALRAILPPLRETEAAFGRLADSLDLAGRARMTILILPRLRRPLGFSAGIAAAFSMGDLGVIALFADSATATLPLQLYRLMAAYRMEDAMGAALLLMGAALALFWLFDRGGRAGA
jgi:thiamine transport system permease protein